MNDGLRTGVGVAVLLVAAVAATAWVMREPPPGTKTQAPATPPAQVAKPLKEELVNTITLQPEAVDRLALKTGSIEKKPLRRTRVYGGEAMIAMGHAIPVSAPLSGSLKAVAGVDLQPGRTVKRGQPLLQLLPLLTPEGRANLASAKIDAEGQVKSAQTTLEATRIVLQRAEKVFKSEAGSRKEVDVAQANYDLAQKSLDAVEARRDLLAKVVGEIDQGTAGPIMIDSPQTGTLRTVSAVAGQTVPAGAALFEVVDLYKLWVRVPIYVGDAADIDDSQPAAVGPLTARPGDPTRPAKAALAPPSANAVTGTVDRFYELDNPDGKFSPGERVGVTLPLKASAEELVIGRSAVVYDIYGGTWVYEQTGDRTFARRRVAVGRVVGDNAVLDFGPGAGTKVVLAGAAELFGTETGFTK